MPPPIQPQRRPQRSVLLALALALSVIPPAGAAKSVRDPETNALRRRNEQLRRERELASGATFYLRLDAEAGRLALMLEGVTLDDYPVESIERGVPQVAFVDRRPPVDWDLASFAKGRLEPERERDRIEIVAPPPAEGTAAAPEASPSPPPIPVSAEESYSVPSAFRVMFADGVSLEVRSKGESGRNRSVVQRIADAVSLRLADLRSALHLGVSERVRLRVTLAADDSASLYRSLPPGAALLVVGLPSP